MCQSLKSCQTLWNPMDCSRLGASGHEISQARILERAAISFPRRSTRDRIQFSCIAGSLPLLDSLPTEPPGKQLYNQKCVSCSTVSDSEIPWTIASQTLLSMEFHARILECIAILFSRRSFQPRDQTWVSWISGQHHHLSYQGTYITKVKSEVAQLCLTLCDPMDYSPPGSSIHGIFQVRLLEWVAISFCRGSSWPRDWNWVSHITDRHFTVWTTREASYITKRLIQILPSTLRFFESYMMLSKTPSAWI